MNASDRKAVRAAEKAAALAERNRGEVIISLADTGPGRKYLWDLLTDANVFTSTYNDNPVRMAFLEGQRSAGLSLLNDFARWAPEQFIQAMREHNERRTQRTATDSGTAGERSGDEGPSGDDQGPGVDAEGFVDWNTSTAATH